MNDLCRVGPGSWWAKDWPAMLPVEYVLYDENECYLRLARNGTVVLKRKHPKRRKR